MLFVLYNCILQCFAEKKNAEGHCFPWKGRANIVKSKQLRQYKSISGFTSLLLCVCAGDTVAEECVGVCNRGFSQVSFLGH